MLLPYLKAQISFWLDERKKREKTKEKAKKQKKLFHPAPKQPLDLHVEVLMGVRCAPNQRTVARNVSEPKQGEMGLQEL